MAVPSTALTHPATSVPSSSLPQASSSSSMRRTTGWQQVEPYSQKQASYFAVTGVPTIGGGPKGRETKYRDLYVRTYRGRWGCYPWEDPMNEDEYRPPRVKVGPMLPIEPLRRHLQYRASQFDTVKDYLDRIGVPQRTWHRFMHESKKVSLTVADEILTRDGTAHLATLYPEVYNDD